MLQAGMAEVLMSGINRADVQPGDQVWLLAGDA
jgi:hypothetical protein